MLNRLNKFLENDSRYSILVSLLMLVMTSLLMFFYSPLCPGGDFYVHFNRFVFLMESLSDGSFPIYMDYDVIEGYGYLIKAFYCDFILIPFAIIGNLTSAVVAYQLMLFTLTFLCGIFTYIAVKKVTKNRYGATISALLFTFATYRIFDIYIRGALGEVLSFTFIPLVLWGAYEIVYGDYKKWYILTIGFTLLIFSHVISSILTFFTLVIFLLVYYKQFVNESKRLIYLVLSGIICLILCAYYIYPMIEQMMSNSFYYDTNKLVEGVIGFRLNEVVSGLFNGVSLRNEQLFPKLGSVLMFIILIRVLIRKEKSTILRFVDISAIIGVLFVIMTTPLFPWNIFPFSLLGVIQFPWRLLEYTSFLFAIAGGYYLAILIKTRSQKFITIIGLAFIHILIFNSDSIHYRTFICNNGVPEIKINTSFLGMIGGEYLPSKVPTNNFKYTIHGVYNDYIHQRGNVIIPQNTDTQVKDFNKKKGNITFEATVTGKDKLELPLTYYKGYTATLNGATIEYQQSDNGLIELPLNKSGVIEVKYVGTNLQKISYYITIVSILLFISYIVMINRKRKNTKIK